MNSQEIKTVKLRIPYQIASHNLKDAAVALAYIMREVDSHTNSLPEEEAKQLNIQTIFDILKTMRPAATSRQLNILYKRSWKIASDEKYLIMKTFN
jgi:hypothetical protein